VKSCLGCGVCGCGMGWVGEGGTGCRWVGGWVSVGFGGGGWLVGWLLQGV
jgi:hypothetical protein